MKRYVTIEQLRTIVLSRLTKGDAFRFSTEEYARRQEETCKTLSTMTRADIMNTYPTSTYDIDQEGK